MFKKLLASTLLASLLLLTLFTPFAKAQSPTWYNQTFQEWYTKVYDQSTSPPSEIFGERYTAAQVQWIIYGLFAFLINSAGNAEAFTCLMNNQGNQCITLIQNLLSSTTRGSSLASNTSGSLLAALFADRPLSAVHYFKEIGRKFHVVPEAYAQTGFGFNALDPVLPLWRGVRDISYLLFVFIIIVFAFMIMFRVKISPQTVITVQSSLPKLVIAMVLVTFSYAIAGFLVDLMYVLIGLVSLILAQAAGLPLGQSGAFFGVLTKGILNTGIFGFILIYLFLFLLALIDVLFFGVTGGIIGFISAQIGTAGLFAPLMTIFAILITIIVAILLFFVTIKILFMLVKAFANILLLTILAPFQLTIGALVPSLGLGSWLRNFIANLVVFPLTGILFMVSYIFLIRVFFELFGTIIPTSFYDFLGDLVTGVPVVGGFRYLLYNTGWPPLLGVADQIIPALYLAVSLIILFIIPKVSDIIKGLIQGRPFAYGTAIGEAFGPIAGPAAYGWKSATDVGRVYGLGRLSQSLPQGRLRSSIETVARVPSTAPGPAKDNG